MPEVRADALGRGDSVRVNGQQATVERAKTKGKRTRLTLATRRGAFEVEVKASAKYDRLTDSSVSRTARPGRTVQRAGNRSGRTPVTQDTGPLHDRSGAQMRWANLIDFEEPDELPAEQMMPWTAAERQDLEEFGAKLLGVEVAGGKLLVPPVVDATVLGHLLTMHGVRFDGATFDEAKAYAKAHPEESTASADSVLDALTMQRAYALHDEIHAKADLASWPQPHWHREKAPR